MNQKKFATKSKKCLWCDAPVFAKFCNTKCFNQHLKAKYLEHCKLPNAGRPTFSKFLMYMAYSDETFQMIRRNILKKYPVKSFKNQSRSWKKRMEVLYGQGPAKVSKEKQTTSLCGSEKSVGTSKKSGGCRCVGMYCRCVKPMDISYLCSFAD